MAKVASAADFLQCDITYDELSAYPYLFNAVAFNTATMEWMVIARIRLSKQNAAAHCIAFQKIFHRCSVANPDFKPGCSLLGILVDWSDAEANGLKQAVGKETAEKLLKGCMVHWNRSCQRVAEKVSNSRDRQKEKELFMKICFSVPKQTSSIETIACFETLCGVRSACDLIKKVPSLLSVSEAKFIDEECQWSSAKNWAQWWTRCEHLKMLSKVFSLMDTDVWSRCPTTTNAVERKNKDCKADNPQNLKLAMLKVYKVDKIACLKHMAAEANISLSYRSRSQEAKSKEAKRKQQQRKKTFPDKSVQFGPPDKTSNFQKRKSPPNHDSDGEFDPSPPKKSMTNIGG